MNLFFSKRNQYYNLEDFTNGTSNKLLIVGYSGSGKTTLGKELAEKYNAEYKSLDNFFFNNQKLKKESPKEYKAKRKQFEDEIILGQGRYVVDGVGVMTRTENATLSLPTIILGTSLIKSSIRGTIRNLKNPNKEQNLLNELTVVVKKNIFKYYKELNKFKSLLDANRKAIKA